MTVASGDVLLVRTGHGRRLAPSSTEGVDFPIHALALAAMGVHLLDYLQLDDLAAA